MFTHEDIDRLGQINNARWTGAGGAAWVDTLGDVHHVDMHSNLWVEVTPDVRIVGYDALNHGWVKVYYQPGENRFGEPSNEFGFCADGRLPNDAQSEFLIAACAALTPQRVFGTMPGGRCIQHSGTDCTEVLRAKLPHS